MKVLLTVSNAHRIAGGAAITCGNFLKNLRDNFGCECRMMTQAAHAVSHQVGGIEVSSYLDLEDLKTQVATWQPDVIIGSLASASDAIRIARHFDIPGVVYLLSYEFSQLSDREKQQWRIPESLNFASREEVEFVLGSADRVFACSRFLQKRLSLEGFEVETLYPEFDPGVIPVSRKSENERTQITGICGYANKGIEIFLEVAAAFPEHSFSLVGELGSDIDPRYRNQIQQLSNLTLPGRQDPCDFLAESQLVLIPSQWPEPFGRIAVEALANGIPVLASKNGGLEEIVSDPRFLVDDYSEATSWISRLRELLNTTKTSGADLPSVDHFLDVSATRQLHKTLEELTRQETPQTKPLAVFHDEGGKSAFALCNAAWSGHLENNGYRVEHQLSSEFLCPDFHFHHNYLVPFMEFETPKTGKCVAIRTWDFGRFPQRWVEKINREFDQFWAYSEWIAEQARLSGIDPDRIRVVSLGFNDKAFTPEGDRYPLPVQKRFTFGFTGGAVVRKGVDILLKAYSQAFTSEDDVCLVIKDHSKDLIYEANEFRKQIQSFIDNPENPTLVYIDDFLSEEELASLFRTFDLGVFPYRAEGFCLPILETMACGTPSLVPNLGACLDFCTEDTSFLVPALRINLPVNRKMDLNLGFEEHIDEVDFCEVRVETLADHLRKAYEAPASDIARKSKLGSARAHVSFTWKHSSERMLELLEELNETEVPFRFEKEREEKRLAESRAAMALQIIKD